MEENKRHIGESQLLGTPEKKLKILIKDGSITPSKLHPSVAEEIIDPIVKEACKDLQHQIDSLEIHGVAVSEEFGDDTHISISQKTLTDSINKIWDRLDAIVGETQRGINMTVSPDHFTSEEGCDIHITAQTSDRDSIFEHITLFINGEAVAEADIVTNFEFDTFISETSVIRCEAQILGKIYETSKTISYHNYFWIGAGEDFADIMTDDFKKLFEGSIEGSYDIEFSQGSHLFIILPISLTDKFVRADMNGFEIPVKKETVEIDGKEYTIIESSNTYSEGTYNIDINK